MAASRKLAIANDLLGRVIDGRAPLLCDGGMGTLIQQAGLARVHEVPDLLNLTHANEIRELQRRYVEAGSDCIATNTFSSNRLKLAGADASVDELYAAAARIARETGAQLVAGDIGPTGKLLAPLGPLSFGEAYDIFAEQARAAHEAGCDLIFLETFADLLEAKAALLACVENTPLPVFATMTFGEDGRSFMGTTPAIAATTLSALGASAVGINCSLGPAETAPLVTQMAPYARCPLMVQPNAGLPRMDADGSTVYDVTPGKFAQAMRGILAAGARVIGGCCGTTPEHIAALRTALDALPEALPAAPVAEVSTPAKPEVEKDDAFLRKLNAGKKVIAIELDSPKDADLTGYLDGARRLQAAGADLLTIADCPIARARMDSSLVACRVHRELGLNVLPHMTCRDRNLNATKALLLGLYAEGVREVLAITGDPIPTAERDEVKNVYQFNSRKLAQYIVSLAGEGREMPSPMTVFGALNLNARNFDVELRRAVEKMENGMSGFLTQPVLSAQAVENLKKARETLGEKAKLLAGIMPVVSQRNAIFMENEINGIHVEQAIIDRFAGLDRAQGEELGLEVSVQAALAAAPYADGFYLMTPFNRVALMERLIARLKEEVIAD